MSEDFAREIASVFQIFDELFVGREEGGHVFLLCERGSEFFHFGRGGEGRKPAVRVGTEGADAFGDLIDGSKKLLVLGLERGVQGEEPLALHIPVGNVGQCHEGVRICEDLV